MATIPRHAATRNQGEPMLGFSLMLLRLVAVRDVAPVAACLPAFRLGVSRSDAGRGPTAWRDRGPPRIRGHSVLSPGRSEPHARRNVRSTRHGVVAFG